MAPDPGVTPEAITAQFNNALETVRRGITECVNAFNKIVKEVNSKRFVLGAAMLWIKNKLEDLQTAMRKLIDKAKYLVEHAAPVVSLILTAFDWLSDVQKPASAVAGQLPVKGDMLVYWKGEAAQAYDNKLSFQQGAASDMAAKADFISTWLFSIAKANVEYAVKVAENVSLMAGKIAQAAIDAGSVFGIIEAVNAVAEAVGQLVENALNLLINLANRVVDLLKNARDATAVINNTEKLPGPPAGSWPQAVNA